MITCSVPGCDNVGNTESGIARHSFPISRSLRDEWIAALKISSCQIIDNSFVCSVHFRKEDFEQTSSLSIRLKDGVVPSIFPSSNESLKMERLDIKDEPLDIPSYVNVQTTENVQNTSTVTHLNSVLSNDPLFIPTQTNVTSGNTFLVLKPVGKDSQKPSLLIPSNLLLHCEQVAKNRTVPILPKVSTNSLSSSNLNSKINSLSLLPFKISASPNQIICKPVIVKTAKYKVNVNGIIKCNTKKVRSNNVEPKTATLSVTNAKKLCDSKAEAAEPIPNIHVNKNNGKRRVVITELPPPLIEETKVNEFAKCLVIEKFSGYFILDGFNDNPKNAANFNLRRILSLIEVIDNEKKKFTCKLCLHQCAMKKNIIRHIRTKHKDNEEYKCHYCKYETSFETNLENHFKTVHNKDY